MVMCLRHPTTLVAEARFYLIFLREGRSKPGWGPSESGKQLVAWYEEEVALPPVEHLASVAIVEEDPGQ